MSRKVFVSYKYADRNVRALFWEGDIVNRVGIPFAPVNAFMELLINELRKALMIYLPSPFLRRIPYVLSKILSAFS